MEIITAQIKNGERGNAVANLQDGLLFLLEKAPTFVLDIEMVRSLACGESGLNKR